MRVAAQLRLRVLQAHPESFSFSGSSVGVLLLHGFTGTPREMLRVGEVLHAQGLTVRAPLLPGHGTTLAAMNRCHWQRDWVAAVETAYADLASICSEVFVAGLSMGSLLALWLGAHHPQISGLLLYSPALWATNRRLSLAPMLQYVLPSFPAGASDLHDLQAAVWGGGYGRHPVRAAAQLLALQRQVRVLLPQVHAPALVVYSTQDCSIRPRSAPEALRCLGSPDLEVLRLEHSGHMLTADAEWARVAAVSAAFITRYAHSNS